MKKGISMWAFTDRAPEVCFAFAKKYGFEGVEVALGSEGPVRYDSTKEELEAYKKTAESYGLSFYSLVCDDCWMNSLTSDSAESRQKAKEIIITIHMVQKILNFLLPNQLQRILDITPSHLI